MGWVQKGRTLFTFTLTRSSENNLERSVVSLSRQRGGPFLSLWNPLKWRTLVHWCRLEFDRQLFSGLKGDVTLIFSFLLFFSCNEMFTRFLSLQLWSRPAAQTLSEYLSPERGLILFSAASLLLVSFTLFTSWIWHQLLQLQCRANVCSHTGT